MFFDKDDDEDEDKKIEFANLVNSINGSINQDKPNFTDLVESINPSYIDNYKYGKGNINLINRPIVNNDDGSISTLRSMSFQDKDGKEVLIPTVINGKVVSDDEAIQHYRNTGEYLGKFNTIEEANNYAEELHKQQEQYYSNTSTSGKTPTVEKLRRVIDKKVEKEEKKEPIEIDTTPGVNKNLSLYTNTGNKVEQNQRVVQNNNFGGKVGVIDEETRKEMRPLTKEEEKEIDAKIKADKFNKELEKGGVEAFNAVAKYIGDNIYSGIATPIAGLINIGTTASAMGVKALNFLSDVVGNEEASKNLKNVYNDIVDYGSDVKKKATEIQSINSKIKDPVLGTSGKVLNQILTVATDAAIGQGFGAEGSAIQGLMSGGLTAQEILDKDPEDMKKVLVVAPLKGYISYLTENIFDYNILTKNSKSSISSKLDDLIYDTIKNKTGREIANIGASLLGENAEEVIEARLDSFVDYLVKDKEFQNLPEWVKEYYTSGEGGETALITSLSTLLMDLIPGMGGGKITNKETDILARKAQEFVKNNQAEIGYDTINKTNNQTFYTTTFDNNGNVEKVNAVKGKEINNPNSKVQITPAIVLNDNGYYNVIDTQTGATLDSTPYSSLIQAEAEFDKKMINLDNQQINSINSEVEKAGITIKNKINEVINTTRAEINAQEMSKPTQTAQVEQRQDLQNKTTTDISTELKGLKNEPGKSNFVSDKIQTRIENEKDALSIFKDNKLYDVDGAEQIYYDYQAENNPISLKDTDTYIQITETKDGKLKIGEYSFDEDTNQETEIDSIILDPDKKGAISGKEINDAIVQLTQDLQNNPIEGQVDIEGNEVRTEKTSKNNIQESRKSTKNEMNLNDYDDKTKKTILMNERNVIIENKEQLESLIKEALNSSSNKALHLGKISKQQTDKIRNNISNLPSDKQDLLKKESYDIVINQSEIRHLKDEKTRLTENDIIDYVEKIPEIISNFDEVYYSKNNKNEGIKFAKKIDNAKYYSFTLVSNKKGTLSVKSTSMSKQDYENKKRGLSPKNDGTKVPPDNTSETNGASTSINNNITQKTEKVKPKTTVKKEAQEEKTNIQDFGEKIGGARKDLGIQRRTTSTKEVIHDYTVSKTDEGYSVDFKGKVLKDGFKTEQEAEQYIIDFKDAVKSNLASVEEGTDRNGNNLYLIKVRNPRTLKSNYIGKSFSNKADAESYALALSMYLKEYGKNLFRPQIQKVERTNPTNKNSTKTTGESILKNFGFKGGEFGNWVKQTERQQFLNYAQDAFIDLAEALGINPESLGQKNAMSIAFGARGQGLIGAAAHFEPIKKVINMTRLKGAGSLAHEYGHSIDNFLSREGGYDQDGMVTSNYRNPKLSENMTKAIRDVENALRYNTSTNQEEVDKKNSIYEKNRISSLEYNLSHIDKIFSGEATTYKYNRKTKQYDRPKIEVTPKQKAEYQKIRDTLMKGKIQGEIDYKISDTNRFKTDKIYPEPVNRLQQLYKEVVGRKLDDDTVYSIYRNGKPTRQVTEVRSESAFSKSALELDKAMGRATAYFSRIDEMWARAFESYIYDKLKAKGITNTYLVHSVNNDRYSLFNPFPAGEERQNINKAFDNLIQTMKDEGMFTAKTETKQTSKQVSEQDYLTHAPNYYTGEQFDFNKHRTKITNEAINEILNIVNNSKDLKNDLIKAYDENELSEGNNNQLNTGLDEDNRYKYEYKESVLSDFIDTINHGKNIEQNELYKEIKKSLINEQKQDNGVRYLKKATKSNSKEFKQSLEKTFKEMTGDSILRAEAVLAGIELRNMQVENEAEKEKNPYSKEAMEIYNKYQNSKKSSSYLYHATATNNLQNIIQNGITTGNKQNQEGVSAKDKIYLAATEELAESFAPSDNVTLRINPKFYNQFENLESDLLGGEGSYSITNNIPADMLQIKENGKWVNLKDSKASKSTSKATTNTINNLFDFIISNTNSEKSNLDSNFFKEKLTDFDKRQGISADGNTKVLRLKKGDNEAKVTLTENDDKIWIDELYVKNQKQGYGTEIVDAIKKYAYENGKEIETYKEVGSAEKFWDKMFGEDTKRGFSHKYIKHKPEYFEKQISSIQERIDKLTKFQQENIDKEKMPNEYNIYQEMLNNDRKQLEKVKLELKNTKNIDKTVKDNQGRTLTKEQQEFFKDSKVRDENGNLEVMYHGTEANVGIPEEYWFTVFDGDRQGSHGSWFGNGFYFTKSKEHAKTYAHSKGNVYETYLNIINPYLPYQNTSAMISFQEDLKEKFEEAKEIEGKLTGKQIQDILKKNGYDGIIIGDDVVAFESNQIKNIDNTNPTSNPDIRYAKQTEGTKPGLTNAERTDAYIEQEIQKIEQNGTWDDTIPVTSRTDIRKTIEDYLGLGIKRGRFRERAYGIYKTNRDVIRTKELKDMDTILHETGHALDERLKLDKEEISNELITAANTLEGYENESRQIKLDEGFAEIIREYAIVPKEAKIDYPQTVRVLEELRANDKEFNKFMTKLQEQTYNYIHQNPRNRVLSNISIGQQTDRKPLSKEWIKQEVMRNIWDKDFALKSAVNELAKVSGKTVNQIKASENAYYLTRLASGIDSKVASILSEGYIDENGITLIPGLNRIGKILGNDPQRYNDLRSYLVAQRTLDYNKKKLKTGIRNADSLAVINQFKNDSQIKKVAKIVYDTLDGVMQYAVRNNLISQEDVNALKESNAFYVPMQRVLDSSTNRASKRNAVSDIIKKRTGSELDVKDVLENIVANSSNVIQQVENNNILKALYKEGEQADLTGKIYDVIDAPMTKIGTATLQTWESELANQGVDTSQIDFEKTIDLFAPNNKIDSKNLITSFINDNGKRIYLQFNDELIFNALMNLDKQMMSQVLKINRKLNMPLRYGATMANVGFAIPNMISDTAQAAIYSNAGFIPVVDNAIGVLDVLASTNKTVRNFLNKVAPKYAQRINNLYRLYQQSGASSATRLSQYRQSTQEIMEDIYGTKSKNLGIQDKFKPLKRLLDLMTYIPELSEQSTRFRVFERNYEAYKNKGNSEMDARILAALESRDATQDFGRTGNLTREINQLIPFSAARVGSVYTFAEKVKANPRQTAFRSSILLAIAMAIKAIGYNDKEIEELNQRKKDDNFVLKIGDNVVTIKKPQGILRSIVNLAEYIQDVVTGHIDEGKEGERLGEWVNNAIMDNMPADSITGLVPNMVAPIIENAINKDLYYNTDIVKSWDLELPNSEQYYEYNSQLAIWLGKIFNYSPAKIDNLISGYFAGLGTQLTGYMDWISGQLGLSAKKPNMGAEQDAVGKRFIVNVNTNSASLNEIYELKTELTQKKNGGTITNAESKQLETITSAITNISKLNKQIKEIKKDLTMSANDKADKIRDLQEQRTDIARKALGKEILHKENSSKIESINLYNSADTLKKNGYRLDMTSSMKQEYEKIAYEYYSKYEKQGIYSEAKLKEIESKSKDYAKNEMFKKYKSKVYKD